MNSTDPETREFTPESNAEPISLDRLICVSQNMAHRAINYPGELFQTARSFPYPKVKAGEPFENSSIRQSTFRHAQRDNRMIDKYMAKISEYEEKMEDNNDSGSYSKFSLDNSNNQIISQIQTLRNDIDLLKFRKITADDIESRNRGDLKRWFQATRGRVL
jgi:hypothetical protein